MTALKIYDLGKGIEARISFAKSYVLLKQDEMQSLVLDLDIVLKILKNHTEYRQYIEDDITIFVIESRLRKKITIIDSYLQAKIVLDGEQVEELIDIIEGEYV